MTNAEIVEALYNIAPNTEWVLVGDDYENINWIKGDKPTSKQVQDEIAFLPQKRLAKETEAQAKKAAAEAKLAALGLTADDLKALGL